MNIDLTGKRALVSGSSQGIGLAIATELARAGASVVVNGRDAERTQAAAATVREQVDGADVSAVAADLASAEGAEELLREVPDLDILVNNLGIFGATPSWRSRTTSGGATSRSTSCRPCA